MKLSKICEEIEYTLLQGSLETEVRDIIYDSRKIAPETMFVCMVGAVTDGHKYIPDAIDKGASVIVLEREEEAAQIPENITVLKVASARLALALMSAALFDHPARKLVTIGLTGTKGKTTTTYMIKKVLEMAGKKVGLIGTIGAMIGEEHLPSKNTTPESYELHRMFAAMVEAGCEYVVMAGYMRMVHTPLYLIMVFLPTYHRIISDRQSMHLLKNIWSARAFCSASAGLELSTQMMNMWMVF